MTITEFIIASGVMGAIFVTLQQLAVWGVKRRAEKKDGAERITKEQITAMGSMLENLAFGQRAILHDRIKWLGMEYVQKGSIGLDNREDLIDMHKAYQALGGNGNLNALMDGVLKLPLREEKV